jgi:hypothetical protein
MRRHSEEDVMRTKRLSMALAGAGCALAMSVAAAQQGRASGAMPATNGAATDSQVAHVDDAHVDKPASPRATRAWASYLSGVVRQNSQGVSASRSSIYFVPAGSDNDAQQGRESQLANVQQALSRGVRPGSLLAFGGPDSAASADLVVSAFHNLPAGTCQGSVVLFMGAPADQARVAAAVQASGATARFADTSGPVYLLSDASAQAPPTLFILPPPSPQPMPVTPADPGRSSPGH